MDGFGITTGAGTVVAATKWAPKGPVTERITWTGFSSGANNRSVHAVSFPSTMSGGNPYYLPEVKVVGVIPGDASTGVRNPIKFSANVVTYGTEFQSSGTTFIYNGAPIATTSQFTGKEFFGGKTRRED